MSLVIRPPRREEAAALCRLVRELNMHQGDPVDRFTPDTLDRDVFGPDAYLDCLVAVRDGALAGYAFAHDGYDSGYAQRGLYLCDLYVTPAARRQGVARALVCAMAHRARRHGRSFLWWAARAWNGEARAFYASLGAKEEAVTAHAVLFEDFAALADEAARAQ